MNSSIKLLIDPPALTMQAGSRATAQIVVTNNSQDVYQCRLQVRGADSGWTQIEPEQVGVFPGDKATARLRIKVPVGAVSATFRLVVSGSSQSPSFAPVESILALTVQGKPGSLPDSASSQGWFSGTSTPPVSSPSPRAGPGAEPEGILVSGVSPNSGELQAEAQPGSLGLLPGTQGEITVKARNAGGAPLTVEFGVRGLPETWVRLNQPAMTLAPAQSDSIVCTINPPQEAPTGSYPFAIAVQSRSNPTVRVDLECVLEVSQVGQFTIDIEPGQKDGQVSAEYQVRVSQTGSMPLQVRLSASDDRGACSYTFNPVVVEIPAYGNGVSRLVVSAQQRLEGVNSTSYNFTVLGATVGGAMGTAQATGRFVQTQLPALSLSLNPARQSGAAQVVYVIGVSNAARIGTDVKLSATDQVGDLRYEIDVPVLHIPSSGQAQANLTISPRQSFAGPGDKPHIFTIRAEPTAPLFSPGETQGVFVQTAAELPQLSLNPASQSATGPATYRLQAVNPRMTPLALDLTGDAQAQSGMVTITPSHLELAPHGQAIASVTVTPIAQLLPGEAHQSTAFSILAHVSDLDQPAQVNGTLIRVPGFPWARWLLIGGAGLGVLLLCLGSVFVGLPLLRSLASTANSGAVGINIPTLPPPVTFVPFPTKTPTATVTLTQLPTYTSSPVPTQTPLVITGVPVPTNTPSRTNVPPPPTTAVPPPPPTTAVPPPTFTPTATRTPVPAVTVNANVSPGASTTCPTVFTFQATVTASQPVTLIYRWERSDGATGPNQILSFPVPGSSTISTTWTLSGSYNGWEKVHILSPNSVFSNQVNFTLTCPVVVYDLIAKANVATWQSSPPLTNLPFSGSTGDANGFVLWQNNPLLNDGSRPARVLETHPKWVTGGTITGTYTDIYYSGYVVQPTDRITGRVGFMQGAAAGNVTFKIMIRTSSGNHWIVTVPVAYADGVKTFNTSLAGFAGQRADFILEVDGNNPNSGQDWAIWQDVQIIR